MAYTNETTHFGFPLPLGTDLTVPMDYNESLEAADTALFKAQTNATGAVGTANNALTVANEAKTEAASATATANSATATANAAATAANQAITDVAEAKDDTMDMICAVVEETATAQYKHEPTVGGLNYYFRYNDILYKTTATINIGDTIVPNTNCEATNVETELIKIKTTLSRKSATNSVSLDGWATIEAGASASVTRQIPAQPANTIVDFCELFANNAPLLLTAYSVSGNSITFIIWNLGSAAHALDVTDYVMIHFKEG